MPPRAAAGDRELIEAALGPELRLALHTLCRELGISPDRWPAVAALERVITTAAVRRLSRAIASSRGLSERPAIEAAARSLGINPETARWRIEDYFRACVGNPP